MESWERNLSGRITTLRELENRIELFKEEREFFRLSDAKDFPFSVTDHYFSLIKKEDPSDPVRLQCIPSVRELDVKPYEVNDPLCDSENMPGTGIIHRYRDRILVLASGICAVYCRHCFRRYLPGNRDHRLQEETLEQVATYLKKNALVEEVILSGGDPLLLPDSFLGQIMEALKRSKSGLTFRIGTRVPVVLPERITDELAALLRKFIPLYIITQFNHPNEISKESIHAINKLADTGIVLLNQAVLLRGINDDARILYTLFRMLARLRVRPYYLFQGDLACGTSHFRVNLEQGLRLFRAFDHHVSGLARPVYAVDLPGGGGKINLGDRVIREKRDGWYLIEGNDGKIYRYPVE
ncbi:MAG: KamA family radical SAM protein [Spirochaetales bacterium]|nr:KamA family radical SAM protein [Spirochaetales bacterium]